MNKIIKQNWYVDLVEDCKAIITETVFNSRWALIEGYHQLGERILEDSDKEPITKLLQRVAVSMDKSERTLWYAVQFAEKYKNLNKLPDGKNISWHKICNDLLPEPKKNKIELEEIKGKYGLAVMDPPWKYETEYDAETRRVASPYKELDFEELKLLKDKINFADDSVLWLWTTHKFIWQAKELMDYFGFEYKLTLVWNKEKMGMGPKS